MIEKILLNKKNVSIYKNDDFLRGVFDFDIKKESKSLEICEMLEEDPFEIIGVAGTYIIQIKIFAEEFLENTNEVYTIKFFCDKNSMTFKECETVGFNTYTDNNGRVVTSLWIRAKEWAND